MQAGDILAIFDRHLRYVYLNEEGYRHLGREVQELIGNSIIDTYPDIIASANHRNLLRCLQGETIEAHLTGRKGHHFHTMYKPVILQERVEGIFSWARLV